MNFKLIFAFTLLNLILLNSVKLVNCINEIEIFNTNTNTSNGTNKHNNMFNQDVKLKFYENMNECLNNGNSIFKTENNYNTDCNCLNTSQCMNTLFNSTDFKSQRWGVNNNFVNGSQCEFKMGRVCDMCGKYPIRADIILFGFICINKQIMSFLLTLFILCGGIAGAFGIIYCMSSHSNERSHIIRRRIGYSNLINDTEKPPMYNRSI